MLEHTPLTTSSFQGIYARSDNTKVPYDHAIDALNMKYRDGEFFTREGSVLDITLPSVLRSYVFNIEGQASRKITLSTDGKLFDTTASLITPILEISGMTDFNAVTLNNRCYITPHNGLLGLANEFVYVYDGTGVARKAAGLAPTNAPTAGDSSNAGNIEAGLHLVAIAYVTHSGFITRISPAVQYTAPGSLKANIGNIQIGPSSTAQRVVLATKIIITYNGNPEDQDWFFVPNGILDDNTSDTKEIDFFDSELQRSADYLFEQLEEIKAGVNIAIYNERLMSLGSDDDPNTCWVSKPGEPESINEVEGYIQMDSGIGPLQNGFQLRSVWYLNKLNRSLAYVDNGDEALTWKPENVDLSNGTVCHGVSQLLDEDGRNFLDQCLIATKTGLYSFDGTFFKTELSWKIEKIWKRINKAYFHKIEVTVNPFSKEICIAVPLDNATSPNYVLYGDFTKGLEPENIRWCIWSFPNAPTTINFDLDFTTKTGLFFFGSVAGNIYKAQSTAKNDYSNSIPNYYRFAYVGTGYSSQLNHFGQIAANIKGLGDVAVTTYGLNDNNPTAQAALELEETPLGYVLRDLICLDSEKLSIKIALDAVDDYMICNEFTIFAKPSMGQRPR